MTDNAFFDVPAEYTDKLKNAMSGEGIMLPFTAPVLYWMNGDTKLKQLGGVPYFGGWACDAASMDQALKEFPGNENDPFPFVLTAMVNNEGKEYEVYTCRTIGVAPIGKRVQWKPAVEGGKPRSHVQILAYVGFWNGPTKTFVPFGPCVLSGKGYAGKHLEEAWAQWDKSSAGARMKFANKLPANYFFASLGTGVGDKPITEMVGKGGSQSPITPCKCWMPDAITGEYLKAAYVGLEVIGQMAGLKEQAAEWLAAWKKDGKGNGNGQAPGEYVDHWDGPPPPEEPDIPF
jgi:hypothetical protein